MRKYGIPEGKYHQLLENIRTTKGRNFSHEVFDRWLSIYHGLVEVSDQANEDGCYPFLVRDETKAAWFILKYS